MRRSFIDRHMVIRRLTLLWAVCLITWVVYKVFSNISSITPAVASALSIVVGLLTVAIGFYHRQRSKEDAITLGGGNEP